MAIQIGTVDGLLNVGSKIKDCFVKAIDAFEKDVFSPGKLGDIAIGDAFQRFTVPIYSGNSSSFSVSSINTPVLTGSGKKQSPAMHTYCRKMGLLNISDSPQIFTLTDIGRALLNDEITLQEYALILISKQGVFKDEQYVKPFIQYVVESFKQRPILLEEDLKQVIISDCDDVDIIKKTRFDILLGCLETAGLVSRLDKEKKYFLFGINEAEILDNILENISKITPAVLDDKPNYTEYIGGFNYGIFDILNEKNLGLYSPKYPNLIRYAKKSNVNYQNTEIYSSTSESLSPLLAAICTKPFVLLAGISGTGKSRIVRRLAQATDTPQKYNSTQDRWNNHNPANFCLIQVKPNWHNSMDVVGYLSNLNGQHYVLAPFVRFIAQAWMNLEIPYFLCLDEMNLAPVEEYFAEFLSAIESRTVDSDGNYWTDPIIQPLKNFGDTISKQIIQELLGDKPYAEKQKLETQFMEHGITLPQNLVVMGTVNMDETTFSFSRKVLDRAMSIEMNEVDFEKYLDRKSDLVYADLTENNQKIVQRKVDGTVYAAEDFAKEVKDYLTQINQTLENTPFKLGYRAINEALIYVAAAQSFGISTEKALDNFTLMKILSRIEGDSSKLTVPADNTKENTARNLLTVLQEVVKGEKSKKKLRQMNDILERDHFVSYWG